MYTATVWEQTASHRLLPDYNPVRIELVRRRTDPPLYAVRHMGFCLSKLGEWEYEPMPSSRDDAFLARCRYPTWETAAQSLERHSPDGFGRLDKTTVPGSQS